MRLLGRAAAQDARETSHLYQNGTSGRGIFVCSALLCSLLEGTTGLFSKHMRLGQLVVPEQMLAAR